MSDDQSLHAAMRAHNLESLPSDEFKSHPLWPIIFEWILETPSPVVTWDIYSGFFATVEGLQVSEFERQQHRRQFNESELLRRAMVGGAYAPGDHASLYHVAGHPLGAALCYAAGVAWRLNTRKADGRGDFAASLRRDGLLPALDAWLRRPDILTHTPLDDKAVPWLNRLSDSETDEAAAAFYTGALAHKLGSKHGTRGGYGGGSNLGCQRRGFCGKVLAARGV